MMEDNFKVTEMNNLRLITPQHGIACSTELWDHENKWYRSRVECVKTKDTISQSWGKFLNLGQTNSEIGVSATDILNEIQSGHEVIATFKHDGSTLIRSVYQNKVMFRTRGSLSYEFHDNAQNEMGVFLDKYPLLNDPNFMTDCSLLFEWVTPAAQIIIKYDEPELYLIGAVSHRHRHFSHLSYLSITQLEVIAAALETPMMEYRYLRSIQDWHHLYQYIQSHKEIEGFVIRMHKDQTLVKVKSPSYITKHGLKNNLSFKNMVEFWLQHEQLDHEGILAQLEQMYDSCVVEWALPFVVEMSIAVDAWNKALSKVKSRVEGTSHWPRKDFAIEMQEVYQDDKTMFSIAMQLWQNKEIEDKMIRNFMMRYNNVD